MFKSLLTPLQQKKLKYFREKLLHWYADNSRVFPWRLPEKSCFEITIAEILLQRTKAEVVAKHYDDFLRMYGNWQAIDDANLAELENALKPLGLWQQRSERLKKLATLIVNNGGVFPSTKKEIAKLPLMGQYIVNAILTQCFHQKEPFLDVNMARVLERFFGERKLSDIRHDPYLQHLAKRVINKRNHDDVIHLNWAILDFAATVCKSRSPQCEICPMAKRCLYSLNIAKTK